MTASGYGQLPSAGLQLLEVATGGGHASGELLPSLANILCKDRSPGLPPELYVPSRALAGDAACLLAFACSGCLLVRIACVFKSWCADRRLVCTHARILAHALIALSKAMQVARMPLLTYR